MKKNLVFLLGMLFVIAGFAELDLYQHEVFKGFEGGEYHYGTTDSGNDLVVQSFGIVSLGVELNQRNKVEKAIFTIEVVSDDTLMEYAGALLGYWCLNTVGVNTFVNSEPWIVSVITKYRQRTGEEETVIDGYIFYFERNEKYMSFVIR